MEVKEHVLSPVSVYGSSSIEFPKQFLKFIETILNEMENVAALSVNMVVIAKYVIVVIAKSLQE